jgi:hypothetical protein
MHAQDSAPVEYSFNLVTADGKAIAPVSVNGFLGKTLNLEFSGKISCIACKRNIKKTYNQGYCFPCVQTLAACDMCIVKPETCHHHKGTCRESDWGLANCFIPHIVYLANSSGLKVGVTRETQVPKRWIDQGATQALPIMRVQSRHQAGLLEITFAKHLNDKTDWRKMLKSVAEPVDLKAERDSLFVRFASEIQKIAAQFKFGAIEMLTAEPEKVLTYPVLEYPSKITSLCLDKTPKISGVLQGVKAQYLIFDQGVINLRKYTGYEVSVY